MAKKTRRREPCCRTTDATDYFSPGRRRFMKHAGLVALATSSYSLLSMTQFGCSDDDNPVGPNGNGDYYDGCYEGGHHWYW